ncbi:MAG TPA: hypothetical protein VJ453_04695 [Terriglobales bacterium]|nr:hypothetical protein [Terriglobales bacterium]
MTQPIPASVTPDIEYWALLDHFVDGDRAAVGTSHPEIPLSLEVNAPKALDPAVVNPGFLTNAGVTRDPTLQACVTKFLDDSVKALEKWARDELASGTSTQIRTKKDLDDMLKVVRSLKEIRFALVDLTADVNSPKFAGNEATAAGATRDLATEPSFGGSMVKIAAMYAAYQLQYDLNALAKKLNISLGVGDDRAKKKAELFQAAWDTWVQTQKDDPAAPAQGLPSADPKLKIQGRLVKRAKGTKIPLTFSSWNGVTTWGKKRKNPIDGAPNLENIFDVVDGNPMTVAFRNDKTHYPPDHKLQGEAHTRLGEFGDPHGRPFYDRLFSTIDASNNAAAGSCILDVGYLFIASALMQASLYSPERGGGLWLSAPYPGVSNAVLWIENPLPMHDQIVGGKVNTSRHYQVASAVAAATFMTLLAQDRLVSKLASQQMKFLMNKNKPGTAMGWQGTDTYSPVQSSLQELIDNTRIPGTVKTAISKLGLSPKGDVSDCALIEREIEVAPGSKKLVRYVVGLVDLPPTTQQRVLTSLIEGLDGCIRKTNHLP